MDPQAYGVNRILVATWLVAALCQNLTVFLVLVYKFHFKKRSRSLVLLHSVYYIIFSLAVTMFSFSTKLVSSVLCPLLVGSLMLSVIIGNIFCVLGVTVERFIYIVYALQYKRIITPPRMIAFTVFLLCKSATVMACSASGAIKFQTVSYNSTVICTVDKNSYSTQIISYVALAVFVVAFTIVPSLWLRIHFLRENIKKLCKIQRGRSALLTKLYKLSPRKKLPRESPVPLKVPISTKPSTVKAIKSLTAIRSLCQQSPEGIVRVNTPVELKTKRKNQSSSRASHLSSNKSSKHTIKIFVVSFIILKSHYILYFPPFVEVLCKHDTLSVVLLMSFADSLFGCLLLVAPDVELKQIFFQFIRQHFVGLFRRTDRSRIHHRCSY